MIIIDEEFCKGCRICSEFCPTGVLGLSDEAQRARATTRPWSSRSTSATAAGCASSCAPSSRSSSSTSGLMSKCLLTASELTRPLPASTWPGSEHFIQGDEAAALGAIFAGCTFFGGYPITPASEIAEVMARELPNVGGYYVQFEDELASISAVIGAAWAGARSMTATSGPGFSLMQENIGYACMTETPCVIVDVQRSGPVDRSGHPARPGRRHAGALGHPRRPRDHRPGALLRAGVLRPDDPLLQPRRAVPDAGDLPDGRRDRPPARARRPSPPRRRSSATARRKAEPRARRSSAAQPVPPMSSSGTAASST